MSIKIDVYNDPCFTLHEAKMHIYAFDVPPSTIHDWTVGRPNYQPLIDIAQKSPPRLSFINLIELYVLASLRRNFRITMQNIRPAIDSMKQHFQTEHPLAEREFQTDGIRIFFEEAERLYDLSLSSQQVFDFVRVYLQRIEYPSGGRLPVKFYPFTRIDKDEDNNTPKYVTIDPNICFGRPILESISVPVEIISQRYWAGESHDYLKAEYSITSEQLDEAIRVGRYYYLKAA